MKSTLLALALVLFGSAALASVGQGRFNQGGQTYYSNGQGTYCQEDNYDRRARTLGRWERQELNRMTFAGPCNPTVNEDGFGDFNYRGISFYANENGQYCQHRRFKPGVREISERRARVLFRNPSDGYCN